MGWSLLVINMSRRANLIAIVLMGVISQPAFAGGLVGDLVNMVAPGAGTRLDDIHRDIKQAIPAYGDLEESASQLVNEAAVQAGAPVLEQLIESSRNDALRHGVRPIPDFIRRNLSGFFPEHILNMAVFKVRGGGDLTLQVNAIRYGEAEAIALGNVVVFKHERDALYNTVLWVHELTHVEQYHRWGVRDFSIRYLRDHRAVEGEAHERETGFMAWVAQRNMKIQGQFATAEQINRPFFTSESRLHSNLCGTAMGSCSLAVTAPVGTPCWCSTGHGPMTGALVPRRNTSNVFHGVPSRALANACATAFGSCGLVVALAVGEPCRCATASGVYAGQAQRRQSASRCLTPTSTCPLGMPLFSGDPCYCPAPFGAVLGRAR